jgi:hypothetical protein
MVADTPLASHTAGVSPVMTGLPSRFVGAWERSELTVDGVAPADMGRAVWVQSEALYVDVRGPGGFASDTSFAGSTKWEAPYLEWSHAIDRATSHDGTDRGHITFDDDDLIEQGDFIAGEPHAYRERWRRLAGAREPTLAATGPGGIAVRVGDHAAAVVDRRAAGGGFAAHYLRRHDASWQTELYFETGAGVSLPDPLSRAAPLPEQWKWI